MTSEPPLIPDRWTDYLRWKNSQRERALPPSHGVYCTQCKHSHPFNGKDKLDIQYDKRSTGYVVMWLCPRNGDVIAEGISPVTRLHSNARR